MGIDIYLIDHKPNDNESAFESQRAYIRESYHGDIYPSRVFVPESFNGDTKITYDTLLSRIAETCKLAIDRYIITYSDHNFLEAVGQYIDFIYEVRLIEEEGKESWIINSY